MTFVRARRVLPLPALSNGHAIAAPASAEQTAVTAHAWHAGKAPGSRRFDRFSRKLPTTAHAALIARQLPDPTRTDP